MFQTTQSTQYEHHDGAGCMFVSDNHVLLGIHAHPKISAENVSGFGGKAETGETPLQTAFRETLEELFDIRAVPPSLINTLAAQLTPDTILYSNGEITGVAYYTFVFTFEDLCRLLEIAEPVLGSMQIVYKDFPRTPWDLVCMRGKATRDTEISHIIAWPLSFAGASLGLTKEVASDLETLFAIPQSPLPSQCMVSDSDSDYDSE